MHIGLWGGLLAYCSAIHIGILQRNTYWHIEAQYVLACCSAIHIGSMVNAAQLLDVAGQCILAYSRPALAAEARYVLAQYMLGREGGREEGNRVWDGGTEGRSHLQYSVTLWSDRSHTGDARSASPAMCGSDNRRRIARRRGEGESDSERDRPRRDRKRPRPGLGPTRKDSDVRRRLAGVPRALLGWTKRWTRIIAPIKFTSATYQSRQELEAASLTRMG